MALGLAYLSTSEDGAKDKITTIQQRLFDIGAEVYDQTPRMTKKETEFLEARTESMKTLLPDLPSFVLPGTTPTGTHLHQARAIARRAERRLVNLGFGTNPETLAFLNRLSDYLFAAARYADRRGEERLWKPLQRQ